MDDWQHIKENVKAQKEKLEGRMQGGIKGGLKETKGTVREKIANTREQLDDEDDVL